MKQNQTRYLFILIFLFTLNVYAQKNNPDHRQLNWRVTHREKNSEEKTIYWLNFDGAQYPDWKSKLPYYTEIRSFKDLNTEIVAQIENPVFISIDDPNTPKDISSISNEIKVHTEIQYENFH